jgi:hypothetical protein
MKKSKVFMMAGTLVLAITAIFATKANKKFSAFSTAYVAANGTTIDYTIKYGSSIFTTRGSATANPIVMQLNGNEVNGLVTANNAKPVYFK